MSHPNDMIVTAYSRIHLNFNATATRHLKPATRSFTPIPTISMLIFLIIIHSTIAKSHHRRHPCRRQSKTFKKKLKPAPYLMIPLFHSPSLQSLYAASFSCCTLCRKAIKNAANTPSIKPNAAPSRVIILRSGFTGNNGKKAA